MQGLNINPWMRFTYGKSYDAHIVHHSQAKVTLTTPLTPLSTVSQISQVFRSAKTITDGLSPIFVTRDQQSIDNAYARIMDRSDDIQEPNLETTQIDYIFALSYSSRLDTHGRWELVKQIWDEACEVLLKIVGENKKVRLWVDKVDRKRRQERPWSWSEVYPYLAWPVIAICDTFNDPVGSRCMRMWPAMECTAGLVGHGLFCTNAPPGSGPVLQSLVQANGFLFNQPSLVRDILDIRQSFSAHCATYRFRDYATMHQQAYVDLRKHDAFFELTRNLSGNGLYGPLEKEEPLMESGHRHQICSARWQPLGNRGWSNDLEWCPRESGLTVVSVPKGVSVPKVNPNFVAEIYSTGDHRLDQRLACLSDENGRKTLLLLEDNGGLHGRVSAFFRYPSFVTDEQAVRIAWDGPLRHLKTVDRDQAQWPQHQPHLGP